MFDQIIHLPRTASPGIEKYQLFHPETVPMKVQEVRAEGYLELFSIVCKAENTKIERMAQEDQKVIQVQLPFQEEPEIPEGEDEEVILPDIKEVMEDFEDGVELMEVD